MKHFQFHEGIPYDGHKHIHQIWFISLHAFVWYNNENSTKTIITSTFTNGIFPKLRMLAKYAQQTGSVLCINSSSYSEQQ